MLRNVWEVVSEVYRDRSQKAVAYEILNQKLHEVAPRAYCDPVIKIFSNIIRPYSNDNKRELLPRNWELLLSLLIKSVHWLQTLRRRGSSVCIVSDY
jgi:hypothetical protein